MPDVFAASRMLPDIYETCRIYHRRDDYTLRCLVAISLPRRLPLVTLRLLVSRHSTLISAAKIPRHHDATATEMH